MSILDSGIKNIRLGESKPYLVDFDKADKPIYTDSIETFFQRTNEKLKELDTYLDEAEEIQKKEKSKQAVGIDKRNEIND